MRRLRACGRLMAAAGVMVLPLLLTVPAAGASSRSGSPGPLVLQSQTVVVTSGHVFSLSLALPSGTPGDDTIRVSLYPQLYNRTAFDAAAKGQLNSPVALDTWEQQVDAAPRTAGGGVLLQIPVDAPSRGRQLQPSVYLSQSDVFPLEVQLFNGNTPVGSALSTFLVFAANQSAFPKLRVSLTVPIGAAPALSTKLLPSALPASVVQRLGGLSRVLAAYDGVPVNLAVDPQTAESLAQSGKAGAAVDRELALGVAHGDELLSAPYVDLSMPGLIDAGLVQQVGAELDAGTAALKASLHARPSTSSWVVDGPIDPATTVFLASRGMRNLIVPDDDLSALPQALQTTTYAKPTPLSDGLSDHLEVAGADPVLSARTVQAGGDVLAAEQTLAELAMTQLEAPSDTRGVAVVVPRAASLSPTYLATLLAGLRDNPFVQPVTASALFAEVRPDSSRRAPVRHLTTNSLPPVPGAAAMAGLDQAIDGLAAVLPGDTSLVTQLRQQVLLIPSLQLPAVTSSALAGAVESTVDALTTGLRLQGSLSVTLTSLRATVPLTVQSTAHDSLHVRLVLQSQKLEFRPYQPPSGTCSASQGQLTCLLQLRPGLTALRVPVEARTSGVFSLDVAAYSPDSANTLTLLSVRVTVRSTAVSFVGIILIVGACLLLAVWWYRDFRTGRRARQLVQRPDDIDDEEGGDPPGGEHLPPPGQPPPRPPSHLPQPVSTASGRQRE